MVLLRFASLALSISAVLALTTPPHGAKIVRQTGTQGGEYRFFVVHCLLGFIS